MNRIFNVVFNEATGTYSAVSENVKSHKKSKNVLAKLAIATALGFCTVSAEAEPLIEYKDGADHTITQAVVSNTDGHALDIERGSSAKFDASLSGGDISISASRSDTSNMPQVVFGIMLGRTTAGETGSSLDVNAKNISVSVTSTNPNIDVGGIEVAGGDGVSTATFKAEENISFYTHSEVRYKSNSALNNANGVGHILLDAGNKISIKVEAPLAEVMQTSAVQTQSNPYATQESTTTLKAKDIEIVSVNGIVSKNGYSVLTLNAENTNDIHVTGTSVTAIAMASRDDYCAGILEGPCTSAPAVKSKLFVTGATNKLTSDYGMGMYNVAGDSVLKSTTGTNTIDASYAGIYANKWSDVQVISATSNTITGRDGRGVIAQKESNVTVDAQNGDNNISGAAYGVLAATSAKVALKTSQTNNVTSAGASGIGMYAYDGGNISLTAPKDNIVQGTLVGMRVDTAGIVKVEATNDNTIKGGKYGILAGDATYGDYGTGTLIAKNNTISGGTEAVHAIAKTNVSITSQENLAMTGSTNVINADGDGTQVTVNAKQADLTGDTTILATGGAHVDMTVTEQLNTISVGNRIVNVSNADGEGTKVTMNVKAPVLTAQTVFHATDGAAIELNPIETIELTGDDYVAYAAGSNSSIKINAGDVDGGLVEGDIAATNGGLSQLIGNFLEVNGNIYTIPDAGATEDAVASVDLKNDSVLTGYVDDGAEGRGDEKGITKLALSGNSSWQVTKDSGVTELTANESIIDLTSQNRDDYKRVSVGKFSGTDNTIRLRINLAEEQVSDDPSVRKTDQLSALKISGDSTNKVAIIIEKDTTDNTKLYSNNWLVKGDEIDGTVTMEQADGRSRRTRAIAASGSTVAWRLRFISDPSMLPTMTYASYMALSPTTTGVPGAWYLVRAPEEETEETKTVKALGSSFGEYYAYFAELSDLRHRLGEVRSGAKEGGWAKTVYSKYNADGIGKHRFDADDYSIHFGYDHIVSEDEDGQWLLGGSLKMGHTDMKAGKERTADSNHYSGKLYGTYIGENGNYTDLVASLGYYDKKFEGVSNSGLEKLSGDYRTWGWGLSAEVGKKIPFAEEVREDGSASSWFVEPQAQLSYFWVKGKDYTTSTGMKIRHDDTDFLTGRLGVVLGRKISESAKDPNKRYVQWALRGGLMREFLGEDVLHLNSERHAGAIDGTTVYYGVDLDWNFKDNQRIYLQLDRAHSRDYTKEIEARIGYRYQF